MKKILTMVAVAATFIITGCTSSTSEERASRRFNDEGNKLYAEDRFSDAEDAYTKAVNSDPSNLQAKYNLAMSMVRQAGPGESGKKLLAKADSLFKEVAEHPAAPADLASHAAYNMGNSAYNAQQWDPSVGAYKQSLRLNPDDDYARENLRLAQLKKKEQEQKQDNENKDNQDKDNKEQQKQDQQQNKDQNKPQQPQNPDQNEKEKPQPQQPQPQGGMSDENAEKILKAMENAEAATRRRVIEAEKKKAESAGRRVVTNPW